MSAETSTPTAAAEPTDTELAAQPVGYWTGLAHRDVIAYIRSRQAELGLTQPQFWLLRNLSPDDLSPDGAPRTLADLADAMVDYLLPGDDLAAESDVLVERGWLSRTPDGALSLEPEGEAARLRVKEIAPSVRAHIHEGISDADYATTVRVLQRMIANVTPKPANGA
ncbi:MarR family winged helix-turn-helix transcriptional regulator [Yinghuangia seranimata]|uniref:MarR family winged helix-turn-helix transcriptional regulator n=1 Tax=Yinghuangia seranimata TaxID=408067 RepID=UPI00248B0331|nr:MarR family winged helix-turn-helix transcriptional regulator [Yinghuangia seranimata]MDI2125556.1 MarR family winged helix-turn-helix transcriptional regulator [Yinghuangia seranimata]